jgi:hypothetical protein
VPAPFSCWVVTLLISLGALAGGGDRAPEYDIKAAYLFNLASFTEWPAQAFPSATAPFRVCVAVPDPFHGSLARTFDGERIAGHPAVVSTVRGTADLAGCHVLFVGADGDQTGSLLRAAADAPVLTVGETPTFLSRGGIVTFIIESGKVRFTVNERAAERGGLHLSSKVLQVAAHRVQEP